MEEAAAGSEAGGVAIVAASVAAGNRARPMADVAWVGLPLVNDPEMAILTTLTVGMVRMVGLVTGGAGLADVRELSR
jgi:hypothetical protein